MQQWAPLPHDDSESDDSDDAVGGFGIPQAGLVHPILPFYQSWIRFFTSRLALTLSILNLMKKLSRTLPIFGAIGSAQCHSYFHMTFLPHLNLKHHVLSFMTCLFLGHLFSGNDVLDNAKSCSYCFWILMLKTLMDGCVEIFLQ